MQFESNMEIMMYTNTSVKSVARAEKITVEIIAHVYVRMVSWETIADTTKILRGEIMNATDIYQ